MHLRTHTLEKPVCHSEVYIMVMNLLIRDFNDSVVLLCDLLEAVRSPQWSSNSRACPYWRETVRFSNSHLYSLRSTQLVRCLLDFLVLIAHVLLLYGAAWNDTSCLFTVTKGLNLSSNEWVSYHCISHHHMRLPTPILWSIILFIYTHSPYIVIKHYARNAACAWC